MALLHLGFVGSSVTEPGKARENCARAIILLSDRLDARRVDRRTNIGVKLGILLQMEPHRNRQRRKIASGATLSKHDDSRSDLGHALCPRKRASAQTTRASARVCLFVVTAFASSPRLRYRQRNVHSKDQI